MPIRWTLAAIALALFGPPLGADENAPPPEERGDTLPLVKRGDMIAELNVKVKQPPVGRPRAEPPFAVVRLTVTVWGGPTLDVEAPPHAEVIDDAWKQTPVAGPKLDRKTDGTTWKQTIELEQVKPGTLPIPSVKIRFRDDPASAKWEEVEWTDILREPHGAPILEGPLPEEARRGWLLWVSLGLAALALLLGSWGLKRRLTGPAKPLPPDEWALQELARIEKTLLPPAGDAERYHTLLSNVVRRYLAERFQLPAPRLTTAEFLEEVRKVPDLSAEQQTLLRDFFERCDLAKFARASATPEECLRATELARTFVRQTAPVTAKPT
jgi:hypothetical protein